MKVKILTRKTDTWDRLRKYLIKHYQEFTNHLKER
jgi:hypothetical protein